LSLEDAHEIAATVKYTILKAVPSVVGVLVHMEPYKEGQPSESEVISLPLV
jgi:divalent metal cation (Fe/Co/Zn/Cd) transporter